jgi:myo-inositol-1(or 4)-monophosphatase
VNKFLEIAKATCIEAKLLSKQYLFNPFVLSLEGKDIKTELDYKLNKLILDKLSCTNIKIISEEERENLKLTNDFIWIIDPLDGTYNLSIKYPCSSISIALFDNKIPTIGVVQDLFYDTLYSSIIDGGAKKNDEYIKVSETKSIENAVLATGFPSGGNYETVYLNNFVNNVQLFKKIRAIGSASIMLCYVAEGVFDVYYEKNIYIWDVAAGLSMVKEAGGEYYLKIYEDGLKCEVLASNKNLFEEAKKLLIHD